MLKVLLADDNKKTVEGLAKHIPWERTGCRCIGTAYNGEEALEQARLYLPDIIITDVQMPIMDGLELCGAVYQEMPGVQMIIISAYDEFEYAKTAMMYGVKDYILKPLHIGKINELANRLYQMSQAAGKHTDSIVRTMDIELEAALFDLLVEGKEEALESTLVELLQPDHTYHRGLPTIASTLIRTLYIFLHRLEIPAAVLGDSLEDNIGYIQGTQSPQFIVKHVLQMFSSVGSFIKEKRSTDSNYIVESIEQYINNHYSNPDISTAFLAEQFNISVSYLCSIYKTCKNQNITTYITELRMEKATELLTSTNLAVNQIAEQVGYQDANYFGKVFRRHKGISPTELRKMIHHW